MASEKANSYQPKIDWARFKELPTEVLPFDPVAVSRRLAPGRTNPLRYRRGGFKVPADASKQAYLAARDAAIKRFLKAMDAQGWALAGRVTVHDSPFPATDPDGRAVSGVREYLVRAPFRKLDFRPVRIEVAHLVT